MMSSYALSQLKHFVKVDHVIKTLDISISILIQAIGLQLDSGKIESNRELCSLTSVVPLLTIGLFHGSLDSKQNDSNSWGSTVVLVEKWIAM